MNENTLIPIMIVGFTGIVILALYLERVVDRKKREHLQRRRVDLKLRFGNKYTHEDHEERNVPVSEMESDMHDDERRSQLKIPGYYEEVLNKSKVDRTAPKKLSALDQVNV